MIFKFVMSKYLVAIRLNFKKLFGIYSNTSF